jgi:hypothetical protein
MKMVVYDYVVVMPYSSKSLEDNSEGELDGESDVDDDAYETEGNEIVDRMELD